MENDEIQQDVDLENNEETTTGEEDKGIEETDTSTDEKETKGKILVDRAEYFKLKQGMKEQAKESAEIAPSTPVTHADLFKMNERTAIRIATTPLETDPPEIAAMKAEINDNYEAVTKFYSAKSGKENPDDIVEDLYDAHAAWKRRNPAKEGANKSALSQALRESGTRGTSPKADTATVQKKFETQPKGLANWYPKKA